jgi:hypothetical protein
MKLKQVSPACPQKLGGGGAGMTDLMINDNSIMKYENQSLHILRMFLSGICLFTLISITTGCTKTIEEVLPDNKKDIALNFYNASDVIRSTGLKGTVPVYLDSVLFGSFSGEFNAGFGEFPLFLSSGGNNTIVYNRFDAGTHRFIVGKENAGGSVDTTVNLSAEEFYCLYFADAAGGDNADAAYNLFAIPERQQTPPAGMMGVRFVHLSPDAGSLICSRRTADGSLTNALPADLLFGSYSDYQFFSPLDAVESLLRFSLDNPVNKIAFPVGVPFTAGRCFTVVISGFNTEVTRLMKIGEEYRSVNVQRNLRAVLRRTW